MRVMDATPSPMKRPILSTAAALLIGLAQGQTYFYIDQIAVAPDPATTADAVELQLIGNLSSTGSYIVSAQASVSASLVSVTLVAASTGGLTVLVPHTEAISLGQLPAGTYSIEIATGSSGILDSAPAEQHTFTVTEGGSPCDQLDVLSVHWAPFSDTALVVNVVNNSTTLFDYPNFILLGTMGDTLAKETVSAFGLSGESWHVLRLQDGVSFEEPIVNGTLELWTDFTTDLACSWNLEDVPLCLPPPCASIKLTLGNFGGMLVTGDFAWTLTDASLTPIATGTFTLDLNNQFAEVGQCLSPGQYGLSVAPLGPPLPGGSLVYGVAGPGDITGPSQPLSWNQPLIMPFSFYAPCVQGGTGIPDAPIHPWTVIQQDGDILVRAPDGRPVGAVEVLDAMGRTVAAASAPSSELRMACSAQGLLLVRAGGRAWKVVR